jgi:hypothetical protein
MRKWTQLVPEGEDIPAGYGISYYNYVPASRPAFIAVAHPMPFNLLIGGWHTFTWWVRLPPWRLSKAIAEAEYQNGFRDGREWERKESKW